MPFSIVSLLLLHAQNLLRKLRGELIPHGGELCGEPIPHRLSSKAVVEV